MEQSPQVEIGIHGSIERVSELALLLQSEGLSCEQIPDHTCEDTGGDVLLMRTSPDSADAVLRILDRTVGILERQHSQELFEIHVRDMLRSEPPAGSPELEAPFRPVPGLTLHPFRPHADESDIIPGPTDVLLHCGRAFGTGRHRSTRACLQLLLPLLQEYKGKAPNVLDIGCGTGLLSVVAALNGAHRVVGVEIDPASAATARKNVLMNRVQDRTDIIQGSWDSVSETFDIVAANLTASVLLRLKDGLARFLTESGKAVVSGFGATRADDLAQAFAAAGFHVLNRAQSRGWAALLLQLQC